MQSWDLRDASAKLAELVSRAQIEGPQEINVGGSGVAVLISRQAFDRLCHQGESLAEFMQRSPLRGFDEFEMDRDRRATREVDLDP
jgi:prevent-host-death family protein